MTRKIDADEALGHAVRSMLDGPGDPRSVDGAKVNALQSIAWSLIGLLAKDTDFASNEGAVSDLVERAGLLTQVSR